MPRRHASQHSPNVIPLYTDLVLDESAYRAERLALLAELTAEQFATTYSPAVKHARGAESIVIRHLELAASLAREVAERERERCAATYAGPVTGASTAPAVHGIRAMATRAEL